MEDVPIATLGRITPRLATALLLLPLATPMPRTASAAAKPAKLATAPAAADTTKPALTLVYGDDHCIGFVAPKGWVVDDTSGLGSRIRVVLYPRGETWKGSPAVMYANPLHQKPREPLTLHQMIERDVASFRKASPQGAVTVGPELHTGKGQLAEVRYFSETGGPPHEAVAYIAEENLVMLLVLSARTPDTFRTSLPAFEGLVSSYQFVAGGIQTPH